MTSERWTHTGYSQQIVFGAGTIENLSEILKTIGVRRAMLVTTEGRLDSPDGQRLVGLTKSVASTFAAVTSHVPAPLVQAALMQARRDGVDGIVSFGGGSCADLGKAVAFFTEQQEGTPGASYADRPSLPHVSIPTTYSGAEVTPFFGMTDPHTRQKSGAGGPTCAPLAAIYDFELTLATPVRVSAETGMNALAHCVEVTWSPTRTPEAEAIALAGIRRIVDALPRVVESPESRSARSDMLAGAVLGGRCLQNASMGIHHGLSQLIGGRTGIAHGLANAIILPHAVRFNSDAVPDVVRNIGEAMGLQQGSADDAAGALSTFVERLGLPSRLSECGVSREDLDAIARQSQSNFSVKANPKPVSEADARAVLDAAF